MVRALFLQVGEEKRTNRKKQRENEAMGIFWKLAGQISDFQSVCECCTYHSNAVKCPFSYHLNWSGSSLRANSLPNRKKRQKKPQGDGGGNKSESEVLTDKERYSLSLTWPCSEVGGSLPGEFLGAAQLIS